MPVGMRAPSNVWVCAGSGRLGCAGIPRCIYVKRCYRSVYSQASGRRGRSGGYCRYSVAASLLDFDFTQPGRRNTKTTHKKKKKTIHDRCTTTQQASKPEAARLTGRSLRDPMLKQRRMLPTSACTTTAFLALVFQSRQYPRHWLMVSMGQEDTCSSSRREDISVVVSEDRERKNAKSRGGGGGAERLARRSGWVILHPTLCKCRGMGDENVQGSRDPQTEEQK